MANEKLGAEPPRGLTTELEDVAGRLRLGLVLYPDANDRNHEVDLAHLKAIEEAIAQLELAKTWQTDSEVLRRGNIIEIAVANDTGSVSDYMKHWEARAEAAEAALSTQAGEIIRLDKQVETLQATVSELQSALSERTRALNDLIVKWRERARMNALPPGGEEIKSWPWKTVGIAQTQCADELAKLAGKD